VTSPFSIINGNKSCLAGLLSLMFDSLLDALEKELYSALSTAVTGLVATARTRLEGAGAEVAEKRAHDLAEVAKERAEGLAEVDAQKADLRREVRAMHKHKEAHEGHVELNIGGHRFQTSVQTLRRVPHTFFDAYFSGRYAQDMCRDGSIFVDRDGEHFGHVLEYMRDGVVSVAEPGAEPSASLLRALKREFGFYCIELVVEQPAEPEQLEMAYVIGGAGADRRELSSMERYDVASGQWSAAAAMSTRRAYFSTCVLAGELYVTGGAGGAGGATGISLSSVEKYSPLSDTWSAVTSLPSARAAHTAVTVGTSVYVLGGDHVPATTASVLKFDSVQEVWSEVEPMPEARMLAAACTVGNDIYVFGGKSEGEIPELSVFKFDTVANEWSSLAPMPHTCQFQNATLLGDLVYIVGAGNGKVVLCFDPASLVWSTLASTAYNRKGAGSFALGGSLYVIGGKVQPSSSSMECYDVARNIWTDAASMLEGRRYFGAVTIGSAGSAEEQDLFDSRSSLTLFCDGGMCAAVRMVFRFKVESSITRKRRHRTFNYLS
jgi:N-acetylneuraminic acid mutarotase